jgi:hypothetical protein
MMHENTIQGHGLLFYSEGGLQVMLVTTTHLIPTESDQIVIYFFSLDSDLCSIPEQIGTQ